MIYDMKTIDHRGGPRRCSKVQSEMFSVLKWRFRSPLKGSDLDLKVWGRTLMVGSSERRWAHYNPMASAVGCWSNCCRHKGSICLPDTSFRRRWWVPCDIWENSRACRADHINLFISRKVLQANTKKYETDSLPNKIVYPLRTWANPQYSHRALMSDTM